MPPNVCCAKIKLRGKYVLLQKVNSQVPVPLLCPVIYSVLLVSSTLFLDPGPPHCYVLSLIRDLIYGDDALLYIAYVMLIWAAPIPADR